MSKRNFERQGIAAPLLVAAILGVVVVAAVGFIVFRGAPPEGGQPEGDSMMNKEDGAMMEKKEGDAMMEKDDGHMMEDGNMMEGEKMMKDDGAMMKKEDGAMMVKYEGAVFAGVSAPLLDFKKSDYDKAVTSGKLVVLYFYADWCPICKTEFPKMQSVFNKLSSDKVVGFRVNFKDGSTDDAETALAKEFGVAYQHTKVFVKSGQRVLKSPEGWDEARYMAEISKAI